MKNQLTRSKKKIRIVILTFARCSIQPGSQLSCRSWVWPKQTNYTSEKLIKSGKYIDAAYNLVQYCYGSQTLSREGTTDEKFTTFYLFSCNNVNFFKIIIELTVIWVSLNKWKAIAYNRKSLKIFISKKECKTYWMSSACEGTLSRLRFSDIIDLNLEASSCKNVTPTILLYYIIWSIRETKCFPIWILEIYSIVLSTGM